MESSQGSDEEQFFLTPRHVCSYLNRADAQTLFFDPRKTITSDTYDKLTRMGFRRSGSHLYSPHCKDCKACVPTRIPVEKYNYTTSNKRVLKKNKDLKFIVEEAEFTTRFYDLYERYINLKHPDGDMFPPSSEQYKTFLLSPWANSFFISAYLDKKLVSVAVTDKQHNSLSAIYTFYDPLEPKRSLGTMNILNQIHLCNEMGLDYLYLGYWIKTNKKMDYKINFKPIELRINSDWKYVKSH